MECSRGVPLERRFGGRASIYIPFSAVPESYLAYCSESQINVLATSAQLAASAVYASAPMLSQ